MAEEWPSSLPHALSPPPPDFPLCFLSNGRCLPTLQATKRAPLQFYTSGRAAAAVPPPCGALPVSVRLGRANGSAPHYEPVRNATQTRLCARRQYTAPLIREGVEARGKDVFALPSPREKNSDSHLFLIVNASWLALKG